MSRGAGRHKGLKYTDVVAEWLHGECAKKAWECMHRISESKDRLTNRLTRGAPLAVLVAFGLLALYQILPVLELIAIALLLAVVLRTVVSGLDRLRLPRWLSVIVLIVGIAGFLAFVWLVIVPNLRREFRILVSEGPGSLDALANFLSSVPLVPNLTQPLQRLEDFLTQFAGNLPQLAFTAVTVAAAVVAAIILAIYFAVSPGTYISGILRTMPEHRRPAVSRFIYRLGDRLQGWIVGTLIIAAFVGAGGGLGLWLIGVPLPLTFGIIAGLLNVIPFAGSVIGGALPALLALTISPFKALLVVILFTALNQIEGNILQPLVMGNQIKVPVAGILISFLALGALLGPVVGAILAVPAAVLVGVILQELQERRPSLEGEEEHPEQALSKGSSDEDRA